MADAKNKHKNPAAGGYRIRAFPKEFERNVWEELDRRFYIILLSALALIYGFVIFLGNKEFSEEFVDQEIKKKYISKVYEAEIIDESFAEEAEEEGEGAGGTLVEEEEPEVDERAKQDEGKRTEATGTSAAERRSRRARAAQARGQQRAAMEQEVAGSGVLAELAASGGGGSGDAVYDVLGESGGGAGGVGDLDQVLGSVGGLETATSSSRRSRLGARSSGGGEAGPAGIDDLIEGGAGPSGSASIERRGNFSIKMEEGEITGKASKSTARSAEAITRVVNKHINAVEDCYKRQLRINPNLQGGVKVKFTILPNGRVARATIVNSTLRDNRVESCIKSRIRRWRFSRIDESEGNATFTYKFVFSG
ncbi:MAG: TonB family protein [Caldithrix sp.]|nr:TonB family protein [Caldithrix sp.]